jgi:hypothetical protein
MLKEGDEIGELAIVLAQLIRMRPPPGAPIHIDSLVSVPLHRLYWHYANKVAADYGKRFRTKSLASNESLIHRNPLLSGCVLM